MDCGKLFTRVAVIDDDAAILGYLEEFLKHLKLKVSVFSTPEAALQAVKVSPFDLILLDVWLPEMSGIDFLKKAHPWIADSIVIMMSARSSVTDAVSAIKLGAFDYIEKPFDSMRLELTISNALKFRSVSKSHVSLESFVFDGIRCPSTSMLAVYQTIRKAAPTNSTVLVTGESGVGKELVAKAIHQNSHRAQGPWIGINCSAIPEQLLESELFGHVKGAFTGAHQDKHGLFWEARSGTLFLDEIGDLSLVLQAKLLRVLQDKQIRPVGSNQSKEVDVRIVCATNKDLAQEVERGRFREDLYYRLNVIPIHILPLRQRPEDIGVLATHFVKTISQRANFGVAGNLQAKKLSQSALERLMRMPLRGNVRELINLIERSVIFTESGVIEASDIELNAESKATSDPHPAQLKETLKKVESDYIQSVVSQAGGKKSTAAEMLGMSRRTLYRKINQRIH